MDIPRIEFGACSAARTSRVGSKVCLEVALLALQSDLNELFSGTARGAAALELLTWSDVLGKGTNPGTNVDFHG